MTTTSMSRTAERRANGARSRRPRLSRVLREQIAATGLALRDVALIALALLGILTLFALSQVVSRGTDLTLNAWPTQLPGALGALLPLAVWARDARFGPSFLWTLPVDRREHALARTFAGWVWLMAGVALFLLWVFVMTRITGGRALPPDQLPMVASMEAALNAPAPAALRMVDWSPGPMLWAIPFTAATALYLLGSALMLGSRHPHRWVIGALVAYTLSSIAGEAATGQPGVGWLSGAPNRALTVFIDGRFGLDALLTGRIESSSGPVTLANGERLIVWWHVPSAADWRLTVALWTGAGLFALWFAASRHRERRRA